MTTKGDFNPDEWQLILEGPMTAGMIVLTADSGGTFRETFALAGAYNDARKQHGESQLLDEIVATRPEFDRHRYRTTQELHHDGLDQLRKAVDVLGAKATPEEVADYREFVLAVAAKVAGAHKEHGQQVSTSEQAALDQVRESVGAGAA